MGSENKTAMLWVGTLSPCTAAPSVEFPTAGRTLKADCDLFEKFTLVPGW